MRFRALGFRASGFRVSGFRVFGSSSGRFDVTGFRGLNLGLLGYKVWDVTRKWRGVWDQEFRVRD